MAVAVEWRDDNDGIACHHTLTGAMVDEADGAVDRRAIQVLIGGFQLVLPAT